MSAKKPRSSFDAKGVLTKLFSCGTKKPDTDLRNAPSNKPEDDEDFSPTSREIRTVQAVKVQKHPGSNPEEDEEEDELSYSDIKTIGKGTFGVVYKARLCHNNEVVAIKKVFDDKRYKNRELLFMKRLHHPNVANLIYYFYSEDAGCRKGERYLNMILEYVPSNLFSLAKCDGTYTKPLLDPIYIKVYTYQMFRCLNYLHSQNICHRDIKPQNLLIDPSTHALKLCDFGSAKELLKNETNVSYICSRYYRAPELIFGAKDYSCLIDMWSAGCVLGELFQGHPLFPGATGPDQLVEIMKILGTPTYDDIMDINHNITNMRLPPVLPPMPWHKIFSKQHLSYDATDLISKLLVFSPKKRLDALSACSHPFFNELKTRGVRLPDGSPLPPLFNFTKEEVVLSPQIGERLMPAGWNEEWNNPNDSTQMFGGSNYQGEDDGSIKNKLVRLARNSFKKTSFTKEHDHQYPPIEIKDDDDDDDDDARPTADVMDLAYEARKKWREGDYDDHGMENISHRVVDLSLKSTPEHGSEKKKKKPRKKNFDLDLEGVNGGTMETPSPSTKRSLGGTPRDQMLDELDSTIPTSLGAEEESFVSGERRTKKKKKKVKTVGDDDDDDGRWNKDAWNDYPKEEDMMRAMSSSTPADLDEGHEVKVTKKKKVKKSRSREGSLHGSLENLEDAVHSSPSGLQKVTRRRVKVTNQTTEGGSDDVTETGHVVRTVVTKTTTSVADGPRKSKKKIVKHYDEDEV